VASLTVLACAHVNARRYSLPLSNDEGAVVVPAIVSSAESLGFPAWNHQTAAQVKLPDGTSLWWGPWGAQFMLNIQLGKVAEGTDLDAAFRDARVRADEIWSAAVQARQNNNVGATVLVGGPNAPRTTSRPRNQPTEHHEQQQGSGLPAGASCRFSSDCAGGNCRQSVCMGEGGPGAPCWFSSDCLSDSCRDRVCR
jgi:hypothetical protein